MYASLPLFSRAPFSPGTGSYDSYEYSADLSGESQKFAIQYRNIGHFVRKTSSPGLRYDVALTVRRPRPIVAAAIACHADSRDVPSGRSSTVLRAYTVKR